MESEKSINLSKEHLIIVSPHFPPQKVPYKDHWCGVE
jgi:hypothetical protein